MESEHRCRRRSTFHPAVHHSLDPAIDASFYHTLEPTVDAPFHHTLHAPIDPTVDEPTWIVHQSRLFGALARCDPLAAIPIRSQRQAIIPPERRELERGR